MKHVHQNVPQPGRGSAGHAGGQPHAKGTYALGDKLHFWQQECNAVEGNTQNCVWLVEGVAVWNNPKVGHHSPVLTLKYFGARNPEGFYVAGGFVTRHCDRLVFYVQRVEREKKSENGRPLNTIHY